MIPVFSSRGGGGSGGDLFAAAVILSAFICAGVLFGRTVGPALAAVPAAEKSAAAVRSRTANRGAAMFRGGEPMIGRIRGHDTALPAAVVRCVNCHGARWTLPGTKPIAPTLDRAHLLEERVRRTGPPVAYDVISFCTLLRTGVDPVHVVIAREMPIYEVKDKACAALWRYLTEDGEAVAGPSRRRSQEGKPPDAVNWTR